MTTQDKPNDAWHRYDPNWPILSGRSYDTYNEYAAFDEWVVRTEEQLAKGDDAEWPDDLPDEFPWR
jgi:hypothetical protein